MKPAITRAKMMNIFPEPLPTISHPLRCPSPSFGDGSKLRFFTRKPQCSRTVQEPWSLRYQICNNSGHLTTLANLGENISEENRKIYFLELYMRNRCWCSQSQIQVETSKPKPGDRAQWGHNINLEMNLGGKQRQQQLNKAVIWPGFWVKGRIAWAIESDISALMFVLSFASFVILGGLYGCGL